MGLAISIGAKLGARYEEHEWLRACWRGSSFMSEIRNYVHSGEQLHEAASMAPWTVYGISVTLDDGKSKDIPSAPILIDWCSAESQYA